MIRSALSLLVSLVFTLTVLWMLPGGGVTAEAAEDDSITTTPHGHYNQPFLRYFPTAGNGRGPHSRERKDVVATLKKMPIVGGFWLAGQERQGKGVISKNTGKSGSGSGGVSGTHEDKRRSKVVEEAKRLLAESDAAKTSGSGKNGTTRDAQSTRLPVDSVELVRLAYGAANVKVKASQVQGAYPAASLKQYTLEKGYLYYEPNPAPADLVFFKKVEEKNRDDRSHVVYPGDVAIVETVKKNGTVVAIHVRNGKVVRVNLHPERRRDRRDDKTGVVLNTYLREKRKTDSKQAEYLSGELWDGFGNLLVR